MSKSSPPNRPGMAADADRAQKIARLKAEVQSGTYRIKSRELVMDLLKPIADWIE